MQKDECHWVSHYISKEVTIATIQGVRWVAISVSLDARQVDFMCCWGSSSEGGGREATLPNAAAVYF